MDTPEPTPVTELAAIAGPSSGMFTAFAVLRHFRKAQTRTGKPFLELKLSDRSGTVAAKVWADAGRAMQAAEQLGARARVKVLFEVDSYQGALQLNIKGLRAAREGEQGYEPSALVEEGYGLVEDLLCDTLVFDIETVPEVDLRKAPPTIAQAVAKQAERHEWDQSKVMSLSPFLGQVVSLAVGDGEVDDPKSQPVTVFVVPAAGTPSDSLPEWVRPVSEPELLQAFWALAANAECVVSYNGRGFDVPFMVGRSLIHGIPARVDLLSNRFSLRPHLDLLQVLGQGGRGPTSLDVVCWALGLTSPKEMMDGSMVATAYAKGDLGSIALYNAGDVRATTGVYQRVREGILRYRGDW